MEAHVPDVITLWLLEAAVEDASDADGDEVMTLADDEAAATGADELAGDAVADALAGHALHTHWRMSLHSIEDVALLLQ